MKTQAFSSSPSLHPHRRIVRERIAKFRRSFVRHFTQATWPPGPLLAMYFLLCSDCMSLLRSYLKERRVALKTKPARASRDYVPVDEAINGAEGA